jgi:hypothetical protein
MDETPSSGHFRVTIPLKTDNSSGNLDSLKANLFEILRDIESKNGNSVHDDTRDTLALLASAHRESRFNFGGALVQYRDALKSERAWTAALPVIAKVANCSERTIFRIVRDYRAAIDMAASLLQTSSPASSASWLGSTAHVALSLSRIP